MLDSDYQQNLGQLIRNTSSEIVLPDELSRFFDESGPNSSFENDRRTAARTRVRTTCLVIPDVWLPVFPRQRVPQLAYTKDFSKTGFGFLNSDQLYPGEVFRVLLATFWMEVKVCGSRRLGKHCFEIGSELLVTHEPSADAFSAHEQLANV
ncbi:MAG: hypothetical protein P8L85_03925 [Rubripirellula sp.]|nr:hypothetical protein [Rubripirellula sp.]